MTSHHLMEMRIAKEPREPTTEETKKNMYMGKRCRAEFSARV